MRVASRLAPIELTQILPDGGTRAVTLGSFWDPVPPLSDAPAQAPRVVVLVFLRHFG